MNTSNKTPAGSGGEADSPGRRRLLVAISLACGSLAAAIIALPPVAFFIGPIFRKEPHVWRKVGPVNHFKMGETVSVRFELASTLPWDGATGHRSAWLRRNTEGDFVAFAVNCTHLGCPVRWEPKADLFLCPCHGGVYYSNGDVAGGPPPRPLPRYQVRVRDGQVEIQTEAILTA